MNEFWAAIAGAIVGGLIAFGIQVIALREARKERIRDAAEKQKALGHALIFKVIGIYSHLRQLNLHLQDAAARMPKGTGLSWRAVLPIVNSPDRVHFTTDEMVMLLGLKNADLFNDLVEMDARHNATIAASEAYKEYRLALMATLPSEVSGNVGTVGLTRDQMRVFAPKMVELDDLLRQSSAQSEQQEREAWSVLLRLRDILTAKIGLTITLEQKPDSEMRWTVAGAVPSPDGRLQ